MRLVSTLITPLLFVSQFCLSQETDDGSLENSICSPEVFPTGALHSEYTYDSELGEAIVTDKIPEITETPVDPNWGQLRNHNANIWKKFGRGEKIIGGFEAVAMTALICMPKKYTHWSANWVDDGVRNFKWAFTKPPVWDKDGWFINYVSHPICGSYYYNVVRSQNATELQSFAFATAQSFIWEYIIEGVAERPSTQDLIVTPIAGAIIGEAAHRITMGMRRNGFSALEKVFVILFNPMFALNNGFGPRYNPVLR